MKLLESCKIVKLLGFLVPDPPPKIPSESALPRSYKAYPSNN